MNSTASEEARIQAEYQRRAREFPEDFYCWSRPGNLLMHQQTLKSCLAALHRCRMFPLQGRRFADVGCGVGTWLLEFVQWGADPHNLAGLDLLAERIDQARRRIPQADLRVGSARNLPWPDASFDIVSQFTVFTSILDPALKRAVATEMLRVLKPDGVILWFDFRVNNPANPHVRGIRAPEIRSLFPGCAIEAASAVLAPPLSRRIAGWSWPLAEVLHTLPFLRTHYTCLIRKTRNKI